jgi:hypothetical protein
MVEGQPQSHSCSGARKRPFHLRGHSSWPDLASNHLAVLIDASTGEYLMAATV